MAVKLVYEMKTCGRCGGSGSYSYCSMYGSTCFGCRGRKRIFTPAGNKALTAVNAFIAANFSTPVGDLKPGDRVRVDGRTRTVESVATEGHGRYGAGTDADGNPIWKDYVTVIWRTKTDTVESHGFFPGDKLVRPVGGADWDAVVAFASTIKKGVTLVAPATEAA